MTASLPAIWEGGAGYAVGGPGSTPAPGNPYVYIPTWQPNTAYKAGYLVVSPVTGLPVAALADFTSAATYSAANWATTGSTSGGSGGGLPTLVASLTPATTSVAPTVQRLNLYDATSGNLTPALPLASSVPAGTAVGYKKVDASANLVSPTCSGSDHIDSTSGGTSVPIRTQNQTAWYSSDGASVWTKIDGELSLPSLQTYLSGIFAPKPTVGADGNFYVTTGS